MAGVTFYRYERNDNLIQCSGQQIKRSMGRGGAARSQGCYGTAEARGQVLSLLAATRDRHHSVAALGRDGHRHGMGIEGGVAEDRLGGHRGASRPA